MAMYCTVHLFQFYREALGSEPCQFVTPFGRRIETDIIPTLRSNFVMHTGYIDVLKAPLEFKALGSGNLSMRDPAGYTPMYHPQTCTPRPGSSAHTNAGVADPVGSHTSLRDPAGRASLWRLPEQPEVPAHGLGPHWAHFDDTCDSHG